jgi:uridine kinase
MRDRSVGVRDIVGRIEADVAKAGSHAVLVGLTGGHATGKGRVAACLAAGLVERGHRVALVGVAPWRRPLLRFRGADAVERYHREAVRWDALFDTLVTPLRRTRTIRTQARLLEASRDHWYLHRYDFRDVAVILLVGIFLLRRDLRERYDSAWWVEDSAAAALRRAILRSRAERDPDAIVADYQRLYFPAQRLHLATEDPVAAADGVLMSSTRSSPMLRCTGMAH